MARYLEDSGVEVTREFDKGIYRFEFPTGLVLQVTQELLVSVPDIKLVLDYYFQKSGRVNG
jgi:hypothetical protein